MKPLLPRTDSYLVPIQLPLTSPVFLPTPLAQVPPSSWQQKQNASRGVKRVRIAPKVKAFCRALQMFENQLTLHLLLGNVCLRCTLVEL